MSDSEFWNEYENSVGEFFENLVLDRTESNKQEVDPNRESDCSEAESDMTTKIDFVWSVEKLRGSENYHDWSFSMENYLELKGYGDCIVEDKSQPSSSSSATTISAKEKDEKTLLL